MFKRSLLSIAVVFAGATAHAQHPAVPYASPPLGLEDCVQIAFQQQPALAAARAGIGSAYAAQNGINGLHLASLINHQIPYRQKQAALGVLIASSEYKQVEWETRYAVTRNYFSAIYARKQQKVAVDTVEQLRTAKELAETAILLKNPASTVTKLDVDQLALYEQIYKGKEIEAGVGQKKALAALREAMGVDQCYPVCLPDNAELPAVMAEVDCQALIAMALQMRPEIAQLSLAQEIIGLEVQAQAACCAPSSQTFAAAADIHARSVPQGFSNGYYRPGALGVDMPTVLVGHRCTRVQRAQELHNRAMAVVDKTQKLIALEISASYLQWQEATAKVPGYERLAPLAIKTARVVAKRLGDSAKLEEYIRVVTLEERLLADYNEALYAHVLAVAALERATAGGFRPIYQTEQRGSAK